MSVLAARSITLRPVFVEPVNITKSTSSTRAAPVSPSPVATLKTCSGMPISRAISSTTSELSGVTSEGLRTHALPAARAGMQSPNEFESGKFQGPMTPTTPTGRKRRMSLRPATNGLEDLIFSSARNSGACLAQKPKELAT